MVGAMSTKRKATGSSLTPRERARLLKEAEDRARAKAELPERQAANARRLAERRSAVPPEPDGTGTYVDPADRAKIAERTRNAVMDVWKAAHEAQLAKRD